MRRFLDTAIAALALLASRGAPWACEPNEVSVGLTRGRVAEVRSVAELPMRVSRLASPSVADELPLEARSNTGNPLRPRYETCGEIGEWLPSEVRDDIDSRVVHFDGVWQYEVRDTRHFGNSMHRTQEPGARVTFEIPADSEYGWLAIGYMRGPEFGVATVHFDGRYVETIDLYSPTAQYQCERGYYLGEHATAEHRLELRVEGKSGGGSGSFVSVDYFAAGW